VEGFGHVFKRLALANAARREFLGKRLVNVGQHLAGMEHARFQSLILNRNLLGNTSSLAAL
jgi:hypothetical protein